MIIKHITECSEKFIKIKCHALSVANDEEKGWTQSCSGWKKHFSEKEKHTTLGAIPCT